VYVGAVVCIVGGPISVCVYKGFMGEGSLRAEGDGKHYKMA